MEAAVDYAIRIIEAYQLEIRNRGLDKEGFCQGVIFKEAIERIRELKKTGD